MAQISVTLEEVQHRNQRKHKFATATSTTIGIGGSYTLTANGSGSTLLDTLSDTEYTVSESVSAVAALITSANATTPSDSYSKRVPSGAVSGQTVVNKFGGNSLILAGATEDIWDYGGTYSFPTTADITHVAGAVDQSTMRGEVVEVQGLDASWAATTQTVTLDATNTTTQVALTTPLIRVFRMKVLANVVSAQAIYAQSSGGSTIYAEMAAGNNQTLMAIYTIPAGYTGYMTNYYGSVTEATGKEPKSTEFTLWVADRANGYEFQIKHATAIPKAGSEIGHSFDSWFKITEKSDIKMTAAPDTENAKVHAGFDIVLEQN